MLRKIMLAGLVVAFAGGSAFAQDASCEAKAMGKDGKPLAGAAKMSSMKKCCEAAAVSADGKKLSGAAKNSSVKKCMGA